MFLTFFNSALSQSFVQVFDTFIFWKELDNSIWYFHSHNYDENKRSGVLLYKREPIIDTENREIIPAISIIYELLEDTTDIINYSSQYRLKYSKMMNYENSFIYTGGQLKYKNAIGFLFNYHEKIEHKVHWVFMLDGLSGIQILSDATKSVYPIVESDFYEFSKSVVLRPANDATRYFIKADTTEDLSLKLKYFSASISFDSSDAEAFSKRAQVYSDLGMYDESLYDYTKSIQIDSSSIFSFNNRGTIFLKMKEYDKAINDFLQTTKIDSNYTKSYYNLTCIYSILNEQDTAISYLELALKKGYNNFNLIKRDSDLSNLRKHPGFDNLIEKYK